MADDPRIARVECAARDALAACARMREENEGAQILLEAARDAYLDALGMSNEELAREAIERSAGGAEEEREAAPLWVVDGLVEACEAAGNLAQAVECAGIAVQTELTDPMEFMEGTLGALLVVAEDARGRVARLRDEAEEAMA